MMATAFLSGTSLLLGKDIYGNGSVGFRKGKEDAEEENIHLGFLNRCLWGGKFETITDHHWLF